MRAIHYLGSKARLAKWVQSYFPPHKLYVEPFGGGAGVLLNKPRSTVEVYNDLDGDVVNFFRVLRDPEKSAELIRRLKLTPYARAEFNEAWRERKRPMQSDVDRAWALFVRACTGVGLKGSIGRRPGFRRDGICASGEASRFLFTVNGLQMVAERLRSVVIECQDALEVMAHYDCPETLFYLDPPYNAKGITLYRNGIDHEALLEACRSLKGGCVLSGYPSELYDKALAGWHMETLDTSMASFHAKRTTECLWISPRTWKVLHRKRPMPLLELCR